jgi:magnesium-transporting ATPase (P-type)
VRWIHLTDKTGTLTQNRMELVGSIQLAYTHAFYVVGECLRFFDYLCNHFHVGALFIFVLNLPQGCDSADNESAVCWHMACTQNTPTAPNLVAEELAYSTGLGVNMTSITRSASGTQRHWWPS